MGEAGRKTVAERFTWEVVAEEMEQAYKQVTSDRKRTSDSRLRYGTATEVKSNCYVLDTRDND
jgi:ubiquitin